MDKHQQKKIAIVTGGAFKIGLASAIKFVQHNITTIIIGRDEEKLQKVNQDMGDFCYPEGWRGPWLKPHGSILRRRQKLRC